VGGYVDLDMDYKITSLLAATILLGWQVILWKKIKLPKWVDYTLSVIAVSLLGWYVFLIFL